MPHHVARKNGGFPVNRGYLQLLQGGAPRPLTPEEFLDRAMREICASCKVRRPGGTFGGYACRAVADTAQNLRWPLRVIARVITAVIRANGPTDFAERIAAALVEFAGRKAHQLGRLPTPPRDRQSAAEIAA